MESIRAFLFIKKGDVFLYTLFFPTFVVSKNISKKVRKNNYGKRA